MSGGDLCLCIIFVVFVYSTLYKQRVLVKAQLGESIDLDMHKFTECGEVACAMMWHHVALSTRDTQQKMHCYQNAINKLQVRN